MATESVPPSLTRAQSLDAKKGLSSVVDATLDLIYEADVAAHNRMVGVARVLVDHFDVFKNADDFRAYFLHRWVEKYPDETERPILQLDWLSTWFKYASMVWGRRGLQLFIDEQMTENVLEWIFAEKDSGGGVTAVVDGTPQLRCEVITELVYLALQQQERAAKGNSSANPSRAQVIARFKEIVLGRMDSDAKIAARKQEYNRKALALLANAVRAEKAMKRTDRQLADTAVDKLLATCERESVFAVKSYDLDDARMIWRMGQTIDDINTNRIDVADLDHDMVRKVYGRMAQAMAAIAAWTAANPPDADAEPMEVDGELSLAFLDEANNVIWRTVK